MEHPAWCHETVLKAEPLSALRARAFVSQHLLDHGLPYLLDPVRLAASELATNAMLHVRTTFTVALSDAGDSVLLEVRDESPQIPSQRVTDALDAGGRGLHVVSIISSGSGIRTDAGGSRVVWASFPVRQRSG